MQFQLNYGDVFILFFLTLGPLKAILPFARATHGTELVFQRMVAWRATVIATVIVVVVGLLAPFVLTNWHVSPPAIIILPPPGFTRTWGCSPAARISARTLPTCLIY